MVPEYDLADGGSAVSRLKGLGSGCPGYSNLGLRVFWVSGFEGKTVWYME